MKYLLIAIFVFYPSVLLSQIATDFRDIFILNDKYPVFSGGEGTLIIKEDDDYRDITISGYEYMYVLEAFFINRMTGFAVGLNTRPGGRYIFKTNDGGETWEIKFTDSWDLESIFFVDENIGWAGNSVGKLYKTTNGGESWSEVHDLPYRARSIFFLNSNLGWVVGNGAIHKTENGGEDWEEVFQNGGMEIDKVKFINENIGWVSMRAGILRTVDGGENWDFVEFGIENGIKSISFASELTGVAVGNYSNGTSLVYSTEDGGLTWVDRQSNTFASDFLIDVEMTSSGEAWAIGSNGAIFNSRDFGITWTTEPVVVSILEERAKRYSYKVIQNYPNPFNPSTNINYTLERAGNISLNLYDITGRLISNIEDGYKSQGEYTINFSAAGLPSGIYIYTLTTSDGVISNKMTIIK